jgi:uncharacterized protein (DUF4213/DUF364 family)
MSMDILEDLLEHLKIDHPVRSILVGVHWTVVCSRSCGLASTITAGLPHGQGRVREVGNLHRKSALELAQYARSDNPLEVSIGLAAINSLVEVNDGQVVEINAGEVIAHYGQGKNIAVVGHFPFIQSLKPLARQVWVIEQRPVEGEYPADAARDLIPQADIVALTGSALINRTLDSLLSYCQPGAVVLVLGPSTPLSPVLFSHGATLISGAQVIDEEAVLRTVGEGATFQQVEGVRLLTMASPGFQFPGKME